MNGQSAKHVCTWPPTHRVCGGCVGEKCPKAELQETLERLNVLHCFRVATPSRRDRKAFSEPESFGLRPAIVEAVEGCWSTNCIYYIRMYIQFYIQVEPLDACSRASAACSPCATSFSYCSWGKKLIHRAGKGEPADVQAGWQTTSIAGTILQYLYLVLRPP